jgi:hypothetical protein
MIRLSESIGDRPAAIRYAPIHYPFRSDVAGPLL